ncbi:helix-turn-helix domain-containing protein [Streptomyces sp. FXJ1.172]|uniref:TetR/AcrR family transcriptional regulator n=1 Tax=Streptomyces sp. FXJ1.172 TaxID=710705 RepID=UPI000A9A2C13|nr:TetR/AcrR family transcriptional regulator [Streptomyces sp. FXJ1.172]WEO99889.1 helix-turn-helix domain containing protein [Streptomyces sp. FXJ1.172]
MSSMPPVHRRQPNPDNPRVQRTRARILAVARELLPEVGLTGLTTALLAERAGVTRQTLYRHWPNRAALLSDVTLQGPDVGYPEPGTDVRAVATAWLVSLRAGLTVPATRTAALAIAAEADHDADSAQAMARIMEDRLAALNKLLEPSGLQITDEQYSLLYGPLLARLFFDRAEATDEFIDTLVTQWLTTVDPVPARS